MSRYGDEALCRKFSAEELEKTFFFPGPQNSGRKPGTVAQEAWDQAKEVCIECPVYLKCRESSWGVDFGVVGGTDQYERYLYRRRRKAALDRLAAQERKKTAARLHRRLAAGATVVSLAMATGYSETTVRDLLKEHEETLPKAPERKIGVLSEDERERLRSMAAKGDRPHLMAAILGRGVPTIEAALASMDIEAARPEFPKGFPPKSDAWVWFHGIARTAHYLGQTEDGRWLYMSLRGTNKSPTKKWFAAEHVDLRVQVSVRILERGANAA